MNFCCVRHPGCGILLLQLQQTSTTGVGMDVLLQKGQLLRGVLISTLGKKVRVEESSSYTLSGFIDGGCIS